MFTRLLEGKSKKVMFSDTRLYLDCGNKISPYTIYYQTYGELNKERTNAILVCHALTGDQFVAETHPVTKKSGWWEIAVGPNKVLDTNKYYVICSNILGGCMGTTGPWEINPKTGKPWGLEFPVITIGDMVRAQRRLIGHLGVDQLLCVIGGSLGGMQVLEWASSYPEKVFSAIAIATSYRHPAQNIAFNEVGRLAIMSDPGWKNGEYLTQPEQGLALARMIAHITYHSAELLQEKFGRRLQNKDNYKYILGDTDFRIESYLKHQGEEFIKRFDANSYIYITKAMDYFDLAQSYGGYLPNAFKRPMTPFCIISFTSDWLFPNSESLKIVKALEETGYTRVIFKEIESDNGHDAFLLDEPELRKVLREFIEEVVQLREKTPNKSEMR
jgi:homoserine O-acetyltransferase